MHVVFVLFVRIKDDQAKCLDIMLCEGQKIKFFQYLKDGFALLAFTEALFPPEIRE
jgi:hypothetical protein